MLKISSCLYDEDDSTLSANSTYDQESTLTFENIFEKAAYIVSVPRTNLFVSQNIENNAVAGQERTLKKVEVQHNESYQAAPSVEELARKDTKKLPPFAVAFKTPFSNTVAFREYLRTSEVSRMVATDERGMKNEYVNRTIENIAKDEKSHPTCESTVETETIKDSCREVQKENWNENTTFINAQSAQHKAEWQCNFPKEDKLSKIIGDFLDSKPQSKAGTSATFPRCLSELEHEEGEFERIQCTKSVASYRENCQAVSVQVDSDAVRKINFDQPKTIDTLDSNSSPNAGPLFNLVLSSGGTAVDEKKPGDFLAFKDNFESNPQNYRLIETPMSEIHMREQEVATPRTVINIGAQIVNTKQQDHVARVLKFPDKLQTKNKTRNTQRNKSVQVTKNQQQNQLNLKRQRSGNQHQIINKGPKSITKQDRVNNTSKQVPNLETQKGETYKQQQRPNIQRSTVVEYRSSETMTQFTNILQQKLLRKVPIDSQCLLPEIRSERSAHTQDPSSRSLCGTIKVRKVLLPNNLPLDLSIKK